MNRTLSNLTSPSEHRRQWMVGLALMMLMAVISLQRLYTYDQPLTSDAAHFAVIAHENLKGRGLYTDLFEVSPPATFVSYGLAELLVGYGPRAIWLLNNLTAIITLLGVYKAVRALGSERSAAIWAAAFWAVISNDCLLDASHPMRETFVNPCVVWAFALLAGTDFRRSLTWRTVLVGSLFALGTLYKQVAIGTAAALGVAHILAAPDGSSRRMAIRQVLVFAATGAVVWGVVCLYFAVRHRFADFWEVAFSSLSEHQGNLMTGLIKRMWPTDLFHETVLFTAPLFCLLVTGVVFGLTGDQRRPSVLILGFLAGTFIAFGLNSTQTFYHRQLYLPVASVGAGWAVGVLGASRPWRIAARAGAVAAMFFLLCYELPYYRLPPDEWTAREGYGYGRVMVMARDLAREINQLLLPGEGFCQLASEPELYFYTRRSPPSRFVTVVFALNPSFSRRAKYAQQMVADVLYHRPELLVITTWSVNGGDLAREPFASVLPQYRTLPGTYQRGPFVLLCLKGGNLESRLSRLTPAS